MVAVTILHLELYSNCALAIKRITTKFKDVEELPTFHVVSHLGTYKDFIEGQSDIM